MEFKDRLAKLEAKLDEIEQRLGRLESRAPSPGAGWFGLGAVPPDRREVAPAPKAGDELEMVVGQRWFAHAGILVLAIGAAFALCLPYPNLPSALPSIAGGVVAGGLFLLARSWTSSFELLSHHLRAAGMALLYFAVLRLFYFGAEAALEIDSVVGRMLLVVAAGVNLTIAVYRRSNYLLGVALPMACVTALLLGAPGLTFAGLILVSGMITWCRGKLGWKAPLLIGVPMVYATQLAWAAGNPLRGGELGLVEEPVFGVFVVLLYALVLGLAPLRRGGSGKEGPFEAVSAFLNAAGGYGVFLLHSLAALESGRAGAHLVASLMFLGVAVVFWVVQHGQASCFVYAMTGYTALSVAILNAFQVPDLFVWLSLQSLLVVTTALWFRSPFIVIANFFIYLAIVLGYLVEAERESGISLGFGLVALVSTRIMSWQRERLQLKTDLMRNAYLVCAFVIFPYGFYYLAPRAYVAVAWVGLSGIYYLMNAVLRNPKYRWMGHGTLLLTVLYVLAIGIIQLAPGQRILSFLLLGTVLVVVSLIFTRQRTARKTHKPEAKTDD